MPRVWPSGADLATYSVPTTVPAPGLFSTPTGWPHTSCIFADTRRPMMSVAPLGLGEIREARARVHHGVVVDDDHVAALEEEREAVPGIGRDLVEKIQCREVAFIERNAALALARCDARALVAAGELAVAVGEHPGAIGRRPLLARSFFAEAGVVAAAVARLPEVPRARPRLLP